METHHAEALGLPLSVAPSTLIESLSPTPMATILKATIRQREPGTNRWPFENEMVSGWIMDSTDKDFIRPEQETTVSKITKLWLHGFWGSGRTVVTASIIEHLIRECPANHAIGYYFCSRSRSPTMDPLNILRTLLTQVAQQNEDACRLLEARLLGDTNSDLTPGDSGNHDKDPGASLDMSTLGKLLQRVSQYFERVALVINSIDFMEPDAEAAFVRLLASLVDSPASTIRVLFTTSSSSKQEQLAARTDCCPIQVKGETDDIRLFVQAEIARRISCGDTFLEPDHVRTGIENYIANNSNGAWLWAVCELDNQSHLASGGSWQPPANNTPDPEPSVDPFWNYGPEPNDWHTSCFPYESYLARILREGSPRKIFILQRVLRWIYVGTFLKLPELQLSAAEMCDFLSILLLYHKIEDSHSKAQVNEQEVVEIGGQLIRKSFDAPTFEFRHYTVEGYLTLNIPKDKQQFKLDGQVIDSDVIDELDIISAQLGKGGRPGKSEAIQLRLIPCRERLWGPNGNPVLAAFNNLATFYKDQGRTAEAEELYTRALRGYEEAEKPNQEAMLNTINNLGVLYKDRGWFRAAEEMYNRALAGREELLGPDSETTLDTVHCLGLLYATEGRLSEAAPLWERYLQNREKLYGPNDARTLVAVYDLGVLYDNQKRIDEAIPLIERALEGYERARGEEDKLTIHALDKLGTIYAATGRYKEAEAILKRASRGYEKLSGAEHDGTFRMKRNLAKMYMQQDRLSEAAAMYREVLQGYQETFGPEHASTGEVCSILGELYEGLGQLDDALEMATQALQIFEKSLGVGDISTVDAAAALGFLYAKQSQLELAELMWERAVRGFEEIKGPDHPSTLGQLHNLGRIYKMRFRLSEAEAALDRAFGGAMRALGPDDSLTQRIGRDLALLYENLGQMDKVMQVYEQLAT